MTAFAIGYDPFSYALHADPYPTYAWMREQAPLYRNDERDFWALSRHADVLAALRDPRRFSNRNGISLEPDLWGEVAVRTSSFLAMDPPDHGKLRRLLGEVFKPRWVAAVEPRVRALARERLDPMRDMATFDLADFAASLPNDLMCDLVGIPADDRDLVRADNDMLNHCEDGTDVRSADTLDAGFRLAARYVDLIADRRRRRRDDLVSTLVDARIDGAPLTDAELVAFLFLMVSATNESTGKQIGLAVLHGHDHPHVQRAGLAGRADDWARESLRYDSASQMTARTLVERTELHGTLLPAGARIVLLPSSGNRDRRVFDNPDAFDLDRDTSSMISFGHGPHFCPGASLARLEIRVALEEIGAVAAAYELDLANAIRVHSPHQRGFVVLPAAITHRP